LSGFLFVSFFHTTIKSKNIIGNRKENMKIKDKRLENKANDYLSFMKKRRSNYEVSDEPILSNNELIDFVKECFDNAPSSFNFKSQRVVVLLNDNHKQL
jgi:hypothetical protein